MTNLRWPTRSIQRAVGEHLKAGLTALGWFTSPRPDFAEFPITWDPEHDTEEVISGEGPAAPNTVGISTGDVPDQRPEELGGGLWSVSIPGFIDIYGENRSIALSIGDDVQRILQGQLWTPSSYIPLYDYTTLPKSLITDQTCEATLIEARWPGGGASEWRRKWRVVNFTAVWMFNSAKFDDISVELGGIGGSGSVNP